MTDIVVYGTLTDADQAAALLDDFAYEGSATIEGLQRVDGDYPTLVPGGSVDGRILRTGEIDRLDSYEGVDRGLYVRVTVPTADGDAVETYIGDPARLGVAADWPGEGPFANRVKDYLVEAAVWVVRDQ